MTMSGSRRLNMLCMMLKLISCFIITLVSQVYVRVCILLKSREHLHHFTKWEDFGPYNQLNPEISVLGDESQWSCICVLNLLMSPLSTILVLDFWNCSASVVFYCCCHFISWLNTDTDDTHRLMRISEIKMLFGLS